MIKKIIIKLKTRSLIKYIFWKSGISKVFNSIKTQIFNREDKRWFKDEGDKYLRFDYDIKNNDIVFEVGAFKGNDLKKFILKYDCNIYAFEPSKYYFKNYLEIYKSEKVKLFNFGFYDQNTILYLVNNNDGSYVTSKTPRSSNNYEIINLKKISDFIESFKITKIKLMNMNIESAEYKVLNDLILSGKINLVDSLQVQFHRKTFLYYIKKRLINSRLKKTHKLIWKYNYVWERWDKIL